MKNLTYSAAIAIALLITTPVSAGDPRIAERTYEPGSVLEIEGTPSIATMIEFADGEHIQSIAVGDSQAWQITPNKRADILFVKPLSPSAATNMTVVTDRHIHLFDLIARASAKPLYILRLVSAASGGEHAEAINLDEIGQLDPGKTPYAIIDPARLEFGWIRCGDNTILPKLVYDDGRRTFLIWSDAQSTPAMLAHVGKKAERPLRFAFRNGMAVADEVPTEIILRSGDRAGKLIKQHQSQTPTGGRDPGVSNKAACPSQHRRSR